MLMDLSLIWSALGRMSKQGLFPIPIDDISAIRISLTKTTNLYIRKCTCSNVLVLIIERKILSKHFVFKKLKLLSYSILKDNDKDKKEIEYTDQTDRMRRHVS